MIYIV